MLTPAELLQAPERVFPTHARVERYYPAAAAEEARALLTRCLRRGEGPALLIGAPGTGKSMLLEVLADELGKERPVASLTSAQLSTRRALLQAILFELGQPYRQRDEGELRLALIDYLATSEAGSRGVLLLVDEAQTLPNRLLEELRVLGNLAHRGEPRVRLLLAGSQALEERFTSPEIETFNQRIVARCYLAPLSHHDTAQYIRGHLAAAGANPDKLFTADALDAAYNATGGIARLINQVCDRALLLAAGHGQMQVNKDIMQGAWADLQQLPTPWTLPDSPSDERGHRDDDDHVDVVEFGPLSGDYSNFDSDEEDFSREFETAIDDVEPTTTRMFEPSETDDSDDEDSFDNFESRGPLEVFNYDDQSQVLREISPSAESLKCDHGGCEHGGCGRRSLELKPRESLVQDSPPHRGEVARPACRHAEDLFGDAFEEEVVIDHYASLETALPTGRPRVVNACETEISRLLQSVMRCDLRSDSETSAPTADLAASPCDTGESLSTFAVIDAMDSDAMDSDAMDNEELQDSSCEWDVDDDLTNDLLTKTHCLVKEVHHEVSSASVRQSAAYTAAADDDADILMVDDDFAGETLSAAAHRADYRQLFTKLRES